MELTKNGVNLPREDAPLLALRRRRKKLIAIFSTLLIFLALIIAALITFLIHDTDSETLDRTIALDPSLQAFCSVVGSTPSCLASFGPVIYTKPVTNPDQIFTLSLQLASEELQNLTSFLSNSTQPHISGCSINPLRQALDQINEIFSLVDQLQSQRDPVMNRIVAAEEDLKACAVDDLGKIESTVLDYVDEKVQRAKMFLSYGRDFLSSFSLSPYYFLYHLHPLHFNTKHPMESINFIKGYGKVIPSEDDPNSTQNKQRISNRRRRIIAISSAIFITIVVASLIGALVLESATESEESETTTTPLAPNSAEALKTVCSVTLYPDSCFSSISPLNTPPINNSPLHFFNLSLQATVHEVSNLSSPPKNLINDSPALKDCADLFSEAASQLERSAGLMRVSPGEKVLTQMKISDIQTWVSAAMTDQQTCIDGLEETGSTAVDELKKRVHKSKEYMSNTLAILNNIQGLYKKFGLTMP